MAILLYSSSHGDCVAKNILDQAFDLPLNGLIDIDTLHSETVVCHCPNTGVSRLAQASRLQGRLARFDTSECLINRAYISQECVFPEGSPATLCHLLLTEALSAFITQFPHKSARVGLHSLVGDAMPLYLQWKVLRDQGLPFDTPRYHYAFSSEPPLVDDFAAPIYSSPFNLDNWLPNEPPATFLHTFVVNRPRGVPLCAFIFSGQSWLFWPTEQQIPLHDAVKVMLQKEALRAADILGSCIGEILLFVDEESITFGAFSSLPKTSASHPDFSHWIREGFLCFNRGGNTQEALRRSA